MNPKVHAQAMFELISSGKTAEDVIKGTMKSLKKRGAIKILPKILKEYQILEKKEYMKKPTLTIARESDRANAIKDSDADKDINIVIDESIVGGYKLENNGVLTDNSFKSHLFNVYKNAVKT